MFTDTHSHIYGEEFQDDITAVIERAKAAGVERILLPNINEESIQPMLSLCQQHPGYLYPMMGLHPEDVKADFETVLQHMHHRLTTANHPYIAIGEIGLDLYWDRTFEQQQVEAFRTQVNWAKTFQLPLMIHCRAAHQLLVKVLREEDPNNHLSGVFHCFGGTTEEALELLQFDHFVLGIGGVLTFKKSTLPATLEQVPLSRIVVETDAPYLAPTPYRGKRNEPAFAIQVVNKLAEIYQTTPQEVMRKTTKNVERIFSL